MWFRRKEKKVNSDTPNYRLEPTTMVGYNHYVLEWFDNDHDEWVYSRTVSLNELAEFVKRKPTSNGPQRSSKGVI